MTEYILPILLTCDTCGGDGIVTLSQVPGDAADVECWECQGTGKLARGTVDLSDLKDTCNDILDKCGDILDKCNDILKRLEEQCVSPTSALVDSV